VVGERSHCTAMACGDKGPRRLINVRTASRTFSNSAIFAMDLAEIKEHRHAVPHRDARSESKDA